MNDAFSNELTRMLRPTALLQMQRYDRLVRDTPAGQKPSPQPEPELIANQDYLRAMFERLREKLRCIRDDLVALELESLLTSAESHRICARAEQTRPLIGGAP